MPGRADWSIFCLSVPMLTQGAVLGAELEKEPR